MAQILSVNRSTHKGTVKQPIPSGELICGLGLRGDAHAGDWHRHLSLLAQESIDSMTALGASNLLPGVFAENITTQGIRLHTLPIGARLRLGECVVEVTQIGKECHAHCEIFKKVGKCVIPTQGIFARVLQGGIVRAKDPVQALARVEQVRMDGLSLTDMLELVPDGTDRQISLASARVIDHLFEMPGLCPRRFWANLAVSGLDFSALQPGDTLAIGGAALEITQVGKRCFAECPNTGNPCQLRDGCAFARVLRGGAVSPGMDAALE